MTVTYRGREMNMKHALVEAFVPATETDVHYFVEGRLLGTAAEIKNFIDMAEGEAQNKSLKSASVIKS